MDHSNEIDNHRIADAWIAKTLEMEPKWREEQGVNKNGLGRTQIGVFSSLIVVERLKRLARWVWEQRVLRAPQA